MKFFEEAKRMTDILEASEGPNITAAAKLVAESIMAGGILQAFGGGHSYAAAIEVCGRAGGLIPSKAIQEPAGGLYESVEGTGRLLTHRLDSQPEDIFILISNSGRNPLLIELAEWIKGNGNKLIVVTALESSKLSTSRHSNGKLLYEYADVILDNHSVFGDAALSVDGFDAKVCGTSSFAAVLMLQQMIYEAVELMVAEGYEPPVYKSANIDGGPEFNMEIESKYAHRIFHM